MTVEPSWLSDKEVIELNSIIVSAKGEHHALLFSNKLAGALQRPKTKFDYGQIDDILLLATYYMEAIGVAHAFEQGNKRTAYTAGALFLLKNGYLLNTPQPADLAVASSFEKVITKQLSSENFAEFIEEWVVPSDELIDVNAYTQRQFTNSGAEQENPEVHVTFVDETGIKELPRTSSFGPGIMQEEDER